LGASRLLLQLSLATRQAHADVDERWLELLRPNVAVSDYLAQLVRVYGLVAPFESACRYTPGIEAFVDVRQSARAGLIAKDLLSLGLTPAQVSSVPSCPAITTFHSVTEAFGWLYVIERSTLLQDGIRRHLLSHLPQVENAVAYLTAYDGRVADHWQTLGAMLDKVGSTDELAEQVIAATHAGFASARLWFRPHADSIDQSLSRMNTGIKRVGR
jgi:heme oxygenase